MGSQSSTQKPPAQTHAKVAYPMLWINLDRSKARRAAMEQSLKAQGVAAARISAVDAKAVDPLSLVKRRRVDPPADGHVYPKINKDTTLPPVAGEAQRSPTKPKVFVSDGSARRGN